MAKRQKSDNKQLFNTLTRDLHELVTEESALHTATDNLISNLVDQFTLGIIFDLHRKCKTNAYDLEADDSVNDEELAEPDIFAQNNMRRTTECVCRICGHSTGATRFANHLASCMNLKVRTLKVRNATRKVVTDSKDNDRDSSSISEDDDEVDWNSRRKKKTKNGGKKTKGTTKKVASEPTETANVDVEGEEDDLTYLKDSLHLRDYSNNTSPVDSASSSANSSQTGGAKKKEKVKTKKGTKKERASLNSLD